MRNDLGLGVSCRGPMAALLLCATAGSSLAEPTSIVDGTFEVPAGYIETDGGIFAGRIETFRQDNATAKTDARMFVSSDEEVVLFAAGMVHHDGMVSSLAELATVDQLMTKELAGKNPGKLVSST